MKILIVEDNEDSRILLESSLKAEEFEVESAENGKIALNLANQCPPELIISDILMPEMDGYSLCKAVKADPRLRDIPFIFYTATYTDPSDEQLAMNLGADRFIVKPMEIHLLLKEIKTILNDRKVKELPEQNQNKKSESKLQNDYTEILTKKLNKKVRQLEEEKKRLADSEEKYRRLVEALREDYFFYTHDTNKMFTYISPSIASVLGYAQEEFKESFTKYLTEESVKYVMAQFNKSITGEKLPPYEVDVFHKDGSIHRLEITKTPVIDKYGRIVAIEGIAHDITKRISAEKQLATARERLLQSQKMEAIGTLAGGIAHDFNNILSSIMGYTELAIYEVEKATTLEKYLKEIYSSGNRAKELVSQILAFARKTNDEIIPIKVSLIAKEVLNFLRSSTPVTIEIKTHIHSNSYVMGSATQVHRILMNLCVNAVQAMEDKGGILEVNITDVAIDSHTDTQRSDIKIGEYIEIKVADTGTGISQEIITSIFEPYFTTKEPDEGTGLGLAVVHGIVESYGGAISVDSQFGQGTVFQVLLPKATPHDRQNAYLYEDLPKGTERILFVDDEISITTSNSQILEHLGYSVTTRNNSEEALALFGSKPENYDLVITDMTMPGMTGDALATEIMSIRPDIPVILCTGYSKKMSVETASEIGIKALANKPLIKTDLAKTVRKVLDEAKNPS